MNNYIVIFVFLALLTGCKISINEKNSKSIEVKEYSDSNNLIERYFIKNDTINGNYYKYFENGNIKELGQYKDGNQVGIWKEYYESGKIKSETLWKNSFGDYKKYDTTGKKIIKMGRLKGDILVDCWKNYDENSILIDSTCYIDGKRNGKSYYFDPSEDVRCYSIYKGDIVQSGYCLNNNNDTISKRTFIDKSKTLHQLYYENGKIEYEGHTSNINEEPVGEWLKYHVDGWIEESYHVIQSDSILYKMYDKNNRIINSEVHQSINF